MSYNCLQHIPKLIINWIYEAHTVLFTTDVLGMCQ